jgi:hypothetical protein
MALFDMTRRVLCGVTLLALTACSQSRGPLASPLAIPATLVKAGDHASLAKDAKAKNSFYFRQQRIVQGVCEQERFRGAVAMQTNDGLVLSGGNQNGAFGAGFFLGLKEAGKLPAEPRFVTGISTGSLQSTFLFLGNNHHGADGGIMPTDRTYFWKGGVADTPSPDIDPARPVLRSGQSNYEDLALAYTASAEKDIFHKRFGGEYASVVKGSAGTLEPLRARLLDLISPQTIADVAYEGCRGRSLYVGVVDADDGQAYALDLTHLAQLAFTPSLKTKADQDERMGQVRHAYVAALLASSSAPLGAMPENLRIISDDKQKNHLFIDGGARFGVLFEQVKADALTAKSAGANPVVTMVINTKLTMGLWEKQGLPWSIIDLGKRSLDVLENQVYRTSVDAAEDWASAHGGLQLAYRSNENVKTREGQKGGEAPEDHVYAHKTCQEWSDVDDKKKPLQFHAHYMACLTDYGRLRGFEGLWNIPLSPKP